MLKLPNQTQKLNKKKHREQKTKKRIDLFKKKQLLISLPLRKLLPKQLPSKRPRNTRPKWKPDSLPKPKLELLFLLSITPSLRSKSLKHLKNKRKPTKQNKKQSMQKEKRRKPLPISKLVKLLPNNKKKRKLPTLRRRRLKQPKRQVHSLRLLKPRNLLTKNLQPLPNKLHLTRQNSTKKCWLEKLKKIFSKLKETRNWLKPTRKSKLPRLNKPPLRKLQRMLRKLERKQSKTKKILKLKLQDKKLNQMRPKQPQLKPRKPLK